MGHPPQGDRRRERTFQGKDSARVDEEVFSSRIALCRSTRGVDLPGVRCRRGRFSEFTRFRRGVDAGGGLRERRGGRDALQLRVGPLGVWTRPAGGRRSPVGRCF